MTNKNFQSIPIPMKRRRGGISLSTFPFLVNSYLENVLLRIDSICVDVLSVHPQMLNSVTQVTTSN